VQFLRKSQEKAPSCVGRAPRGKKQTVIMNPDAPRVCLPAWSSKRNAYGAFRAWPTWIRLPGVAW
jgi:hypothetical protein